MVSHENPTETGNPSLLGKEKTQSSVTHLKQLIFNHFYFPQASFNPIVPHFLHAIRARH